MSDAVWVALVTGGCTLAATYIANKTLADREDRRRAVDVARENALERIERLYKPLLAMLDPGPPYDEFCFDDRLCSEVVDLIEENDRYASPDLMNVFWVLRRKHHDPNYVVRSEPALELFRVANLEYAELKALLGYGTILEKDGIIKQGYEVIVGGIRTIFGKAKDNLRRLQRKRRGRWTRPKKP